MENSENTKDIEAIANEISKSLYPELHTAKPVVPRGTDSAELITVIRTVALRGSGEIGDVYRRVVQYWDTDGKFLAENDPLPKR